jgi:hypothetical protein
MVRCSSLPSFRSILKFVPEGMQTAYNLGCITSPCNLTYRICTIHFCSSVALVMARVDTTLLPQRSRRLAGIGARRSGGDRIWQRMLSGKPDPPVVSSLVISRLTLLTNTQVDSRIYPPNELGPRSDVVSSTRRKYQEKTTARKSLTN